MVKTTIAYLNHADISPELLAELRVKAANRRYYNKRHGSKRV
jgi:hypothetical protein